MIISKDMSLDKYSAIKADFTPPIIPKQPITIVQAPNIGNINNYNNFNIN